MATDADFSIGASNNGTGHYYDGMIDDVRIWNDLRTSAEISNNYNKELVGNEANLVGYWRLSNNLQDNTSNANNLTHSGTEAYSADTPLDSDSNRALDFTSSNSEYVYITDGSQTNLDITGSMTIEAKVKLKTKDTPQFIASKERFNSSADRGYSLWIDQNNKINVSLSGDQTGTTSAQAIGGTALDINTWYHIAAVYDGNDIRIYLDAILDSNDGDLTDVDGDGYDSTAVGGIDCDDSNAGINPGAIEIPGNGIDEDCDPSTYATVSGSGYNYPESGFQASLSLDIQASSLETGWLNYYYSKLRINLVSTLIAGLSVNGNTITITGEGTVNGVSGYTFTIIITAANPDTMEIIIYNSDGTVYFNSGPGALSSGDFNITTDYTIQYQLTTSVSPAGSGSVDPDCSAVCQYDSSTLTTITASENTGYTFDDWAGCDSPSNNLCTMTMNADKNVTANFQACAQPVRINGTTPVYYSSLQDAYIAAADGNTIQIQALSFTENLNINKTIILQGGFDCNFTTVIGSTTLNGNITINDGIVTIENIILGN